MTDRTKTTGLLTRFIVRRADLSPHTLGSLSPRDGLCEDVYLASDVHQLLSTLLPLIQPFIQYGVQLRAHNIPDTANIAYQPTEMPGDALTAGDCFKWTRVLPHVHAMLTADSPSYTAEERAKWWVGWCPTCGWKGISRDAHGGHPIADTGDYEDVTCPYCDSILEDPPDT